MPSRVVASSSSLLFNSASISYSSAQPHPSSSILPRCSVSSSSSSQPSCLFLLPLPLTLKLQHLFVFFLFLFLGAVRDIGDRESSLRGLPRTSRGFRGTALQITHLRRRRGCPHPAQRCDDEPGHVYRGFQRIRQGSDGGEAAEEEAHGRGLRYFGDSGQYRFSEMAVSRWKRHLQDD